MTRADICRERAAEVGWAQAVKEIYDQEPTTAKEYAKMLRRFGMYVRDIAVLCRLKYGVGSNAWVLINTDPEQYLKHLNRNKLWKRK